MGIFSGSGMSSRPRVTKVDNNLKGGSWGGAGASSAWGGGQGIGQWGGFQGTGGKTMNDASGQIGRGFGQGGMYGAGDPLSMVSSDINPQATYSTQQTQGATNNIAATGHQQGNMPYILRQMARPGVSNSPGTLSQAAVQSAGAQAGAAGAAEQLRVSDATENARMLLGGETARAADLTGQASGLVSNWGTNADNIRGNQTSMFNAMNNWTQGEGQAIGNETQDRYSAAQIGTGWDALNNRYNAGMMQQMLGMIPRQQNPLLGSLYG